MSDASSADVVVIGMGPGGEDVAGSLAEAGLDVVGIEAKLVGGECPYWGCIPSKMTIRAANLLAEARRIPRMSGESTVRPDWAPVAQRISDEATTGWDDQIAVERFEGKGGRLVRGRGRITGPGRVAVGGEVIDARHGIVLSTGTDPAVPPIPGLEAVPYWTNREAVEAKELPESMIVLGGGAVGVELAQAFARFGVKMTVVELADHLLPLEEPEVGDILGEVFAAEGINVRVSAKAVNVSQDGAGFSVELAGGETVSAAQLLVATGRKTDLAGLGVGAVGIDESLPAIPVDENLRAAQDVWAVGDVTGKGLFTHMSLYQSAIAVADILGKDHRPADYRAVPRATFADPEVGSVGLSEKQAREAGIAVRTGQAWGPHVARGFMHKAGNEGLVKLVADSTNDVLVGATSMGPHGGDVLGLLTLAVHASIPLDTLRGMIYAYPTFHGGVQDALRDLG